MTNNRIVILALTTFGLVASPSFSEGTMNASAEAASGWTCRNVDLEISCTEEACAVADAHTPLSVTASASEINVCAYSGCWEGVPSVSLLSGQFQTYSGTKLVFSSNPDDRTDVSITVDNATGVATILVAGMYAQPMLCEAR